MRFNSVSIKVVIRSLSDYKVNVVAELAFVPSDPSQGTLTCSLGCRIELSTVIFEGQVRTLIPWFLSL